MSEPVLKKLYSQKTIAAHVRRLGEEISRDFAGEDILCVGVLKGAFLFFSDLVRRLTVASSVDFVRVASYGSGTQSSGIVELRQDLETTVQGRNVIIIDDILDTGFSLQFLYHHLQGRRPKTLKTCVLLDKTGNRKIPFAADYVGMALESGFVVGYGLDYQERYRSLADIYLLQENQAASARGLA
ncbi:MAG: hypoxanthine phosphoribosyltransferase [Syntrophotaleaceae bacterium]